MIVCTHCQAENVAGAVRCAACGKPLDPGTPDAPPAATPATAQVSRLGIQIAAVAGVVAVIAFFALPYVHLGLFGTANGAQLTNLLSSATLLWLEVLFAAVAGGVATAQAITMRQSRSPASRRVSAIVCIAGILSLLILLSQLFGMQTATVGRIAPSDLGLGFWLMLLAVCAVVGGALAQLRVYRALPPVAWRRPV